tara:strand:+ start:1784 stop:2743 length:960 start_codon:yes stop_codon:yes gene_type:complete
MSFDKQKFSIPWDWVLVIISLVGANLVIKSQVNTNLRIRSYVNEAVELSKRDMEKKPGIDILILGDSRSAEIDTQVLRSSLNPQSIEIQNASSNSGSWVSSYSLLRMAQNKLTEDATTILCVSEYWLEQPDYQTRAGILPAFRDYWALGQPALSITALLPLSAKRGQIVNGARQWSESLFHGPGQEDPLNDYYKGMKKSNVDLWFSPIKKEQIAKNLAFADHALRKIKEMAPNLILVYLPNAKKRESYVEKEYKGRKKRFLENITRLSRKHDLRFENLSNKEELTRDGLYKDFHHWNDEGVQEGTEWLAKRLTDLQAPE